ncbi:PREDICTED: pentatricopeptide repeat-containing protein At1g30610, chloroplastic [Brassica oleracea var. oleracea]|uniref:Pentacotripeptide-repeat region of PRORP domain-containing protein n=1 Tax=Brassica oleracea var. oleracea TaxID=109376 RepID=A0A0D3CEY5_BRAOL|nr:PREDICTED: pentatricopeptide repeat-containing protein At1g30610, chloroplastic [Brassica oleracea var. oleracea]
MIVDRFRTLKLQSEMAVMISTISFVNASFLDESLNFRRNSLRRPVFPQAWFNGRRLVPLKSKKNVILCLNLNAKEVSEFKPSFDQYLQIMESVKTARNKKKKVDALVIDKGEDDGARRRLVLGRGVEDVKTKDEGFRRRYSRQELVSGEKRDDGRGFKRNEESGIQRDVKWSKSVETSSATVPEDESFRRRKYAKQEMVKYPRSPRGIERGSKADVLGDMRFQRTAKDVKWSKTGESCSVTAPEDESFNKRYVRQEMVSYHRSPDASKGIDRGSNADTVGDRRFQRIAKDVKWSKSGEPSVIVPEDEGFRRQNPKQEMMRYQRVNGTSRGSERGSRGDGLDLLAEESRIERLAIERHELRSSKLSRTRIVGAKKDDDGLFDMESPAFRFSDESSDIVDKPATSRLEMEDRIEKLAKVLNGADINMPEWLFSKAIRSAKIRYTDYTIMRLIHFLGKLGNWRRVLQVIEWLQRQDRFKSNKLRIVYTTALNVLGKSRRPVEALNVFHAMMLQISSYPDMVAYRSIAVTLGQAGHIKELFHVIDTMRSPPKKKFKPTTLAKWDPRLEPDVVVYNAVLNACVQRKQWEGAFWVLQQLKQKGQKPSPVTYGLVMEVMLACEKYNLVHEFFRKMQKSSIPNALAYRVLVNTLWKEGKTDEAIQTVEDMESRGIVGSAALYYDLARCLCSAGRCNEGLNTIKKICRVANKPLVVTYTGLIQACLDSGNVKNAAYIFDQMKEVCNPNLVTCNIMLKAYLQQDGLFEEGRELFQKMLEDGNNIESSSDFESRVLPDTYTFNTMLEACAEHKKWDDFGYAYREMLRHGYHFNAKRHLKMVLEASRAGQEEVMEETWEHLRRSNRIPPSPLIKERFCRKLEKGDHATAISSLAVLNGNIEETELRAWSTDAWSKVLYRFEKDSVLRLMDDVNRRVGLRSESSDSVLGNLLSSCKEFLKNRTQVL